MMIRKGHIKFGGYTVAELTIAMIITTIVLAIAGTALVLTQRQLFRFDDRSEEIFEQSQTVYLLRKDFNLADSVLYTDDHLQLFRQGKETVYAFEQGRVLRRQPPVTDTLQVPLEVQQVVRRYGLVSQINLSLMVTGREYFINLEKTYTPAILADRIF